MLVGEPAFACQLHSRDGLVLDFDDPGCLLLWRAEHPEAVRAAYLHLHDADRWLPLEAVAFRAVASSPMGYGLAAVPRGAADGLELADAVRRARERDAARAPR